MPSIGEVILNVRMMLPSHVANDVAKPASDVANYVAKPVIWTVGWQHLIPVLNTERAFAAVFRLSLSEFGRNL
jgi:hypothetical protein